MLQFLVTLNLEPKEQQLRDWTIFVPDNLSCVISYSYARSHAKVCIMAGGVHASVPTWPKQEDENCLFFLRFDCC
jgi:hypothetical protein